MKNILALLLMMICFNSYAFTPTDSASFQAVDDLEEILIQAEADASSVGRAILVTSRLMIADQDTVIGSCWDFIDEVYKRAGFSSEQRVTVFKSKLAGPYASEESIEACDWLYFINHSYGNVEHSGIFVAWTDLQKKEALMISYPGGSQSKSGRYKRYDLSSVYNIIRPR
jgi:hypothetical protein